MRPRNHSPPLLLALLLILTPNHAASTLNSVPEDVAAFPKYVVRFLNGLPIDNHTAYSWLANGVPRGLPEFLADAAPSIDSGQPHQQPPSSDNHDSPTGSDNGSLQLMRMGQHKTFLCHIPPPPPTPPSFADNDREEVSPAKSWQLLSALAGTCLYHRQGWFTYSYCHNLHVRQFREVVHTQPQLGFQPPEEDEEWESFTLGRSPTADLTSDLVATDETALAQNLEVARGARERYLVQRWGDGTVCDKTGRQREIEVQFHCSTTTVDTIMFIKETATCKYVLVIHTPRLCSEPGFKSRAEHTEEAAIRCREIVDDVSQIDRSTVESVHPRRRYVRQTLAGSEAGAAAKGHSATGTKKRGDAGQEDKFTPGLVERLMEMIAGAKEGEVSLVALDEDGDGRRYFVVGDGDDRFMAELADSVPRQQKEDGESKKEDGDDSLHKKKDHNHEDL